MAEAPTPGASRRQDEIEAAQQVMTIRVRDEVYRIAGGNIPMRVHDYFELQTGRSVEYVLSTDRTIGILQVTLACYLGALLRDPARLTLKWAAFRDAMPRDLTDEDLDVTVDDPDGDDPEA